MSTRVGNSRLLSISTAATYVAALKEIKTSILAAGWIQTADSGQVNWDSVVALPSASTFRDYEIFRMADTSQATFPVFLKIEYSIQGTNNFLIKFTLGSSTDGAGAFIGDTAVISTGFGVETSSNGVSLSSGDTGRFSMFLSDTAVAGPFFMVERSRGSNGANTDQYVTLAFVGYQNTAGVQSKQVSLFKIGGAAPVSSFVVVAIPKDSVSGVFGDSVLMSPIFPSIGRLGNPLLSALALKHGDVANGALVVVSAYGTDHTYRVIGWTTTNSGTVKMAGFGVDYVSVAILWE